MCDAQEMQREVNLESKSDIEWLNWGCLEVTV